MPFDYWRLGIGDWLKSQVSNLRTKQFNYNNLLEEDV
jgi:hypothetical protein